MDEKLSLQITIDSTQAERALEKANKVIDAIKKAKYLALDLANIMDNMSFKPTIGETPADVQ